jgi:hypothetical protein
MIRTFIPNRSFILQVNDAIVVAPVAGAGRIEWRLA